MSRALVFLLAHALTRPAAAEPARVRLDYQRDAGACPDEAAIREAVAARLGRDPFDERAAVAIRVAVAGAGTRARIELAGGARDLAARGCDELSEAIVLALAIAVDDLAATPVVAPPPPPPTLPSVPSVVRPAPPSPARLRLSAGLHVAVALAPAPTLGFTTAVGGRFGRWSLDLEARAHLPSTAAFSSGSVTTQVVVGTLVPCVRASLFVGCALLAAGAQIASTRGTDGESGATTPWAGAGARAGLEIPLWRTLALVVSADLLAPFLRSRLLVDGAEAFVTPPVSGAFAFGAEGEIP